MQLQITDRNNIYEFYKGKTRLAERTIKKDINIQAKFSAEFEGCADARLHITSASFNYKVYLNGILFTTVRQEPLTDMRGLTLFILTLYPVKTSFPLRRRVITATAFVL